MTPSKSSCGVGHYQCLFYGSENYSGKKIPWTAMSVWVRLPPAVQFKYIEILKHRAIPNNLLFFKISMYLFGNVNIY